MKLGFGARLTLLNALVVGALIVGVALILTATTQQQVAESIDRELRNRAFGVARGPMGPPGRAREPRGPNDAMNPPRIPDGDRFRPRTFRRGDGVMALDRRGGERAIAERQMILSTVTLPDGVRVRVISMPLPADDERGEVAQLGMPLAEFDRMVATQRSIILVMLPVAVVLAGLVGSMLAKRAIKPIRDLTRTAESVSGDRLSGRLEVTGGDELATLASTFNSMMDRLERAFEREKRMVGDATHELKTPLARIKLAASTALGNDQTDEDRVYALRVVDASSDRMTDLVQQMLTLARASEAHSGGAETVDLVTVMGEIVRELADPRVVMMGPSVVVQGSKAEWRIIGENIVRNALRHVDASNGQVQVEWSESAWRCRDNGTGIAAVHLDRLTDRFYRVDDARSRKDGGSGLGLAIVKAILDRHDYPLRFESEVGQGTIVTIELQKKI